MLFLFDRIRSESRVRFALTALFVPCALFCLLQVHAQAVVPTDPADGGYTISLASATQDWLSWMPAAGSEIEFTATTDASYDNGKVIFRLSDVTQYPGKYMNDLHGREDLSNDVEFLPADQQDNLGGKLEWRVGDMGEWAEARWEDRPVPTPADIVITVKLKCKDYAAYAKIKAQLVQRNFDLWTPIAASYHHTIPFDIYPVEIELVGGIFPKITFGNKAADVWDAQYTVTFTADRLGMDRDDHGTFDGVPHGRNAGDGLTVLEEYRGFMVQQSHTRLNPLEKDVFIYSIVEPVTINGETYFDRGDIGYAGSLPMNAHHLSSADCPHNVVWINIAEMPSQRVQHAILVQVSELERPAVNALGVAIPALGEGGNTPQTAPTCIVYIKVMIENLAEHGGGADEVREFIASTIAHEVGHAVGLRHHDVQDDVPIDPTHNGEECVMLGSNGHLDVPEIIRWAGNRYAEFHSHPDWEDHWEQYRLHTKL